MTMRIYLLLLSLLVCLSSPHPATAQEDGAEPDRPTSRWIDISGQWFLAFQHRNINANVSNAFVLKRGYITFSKDLNERFSVRFTQDIITDDEGDDAGNIEMRLKYCYLKVKPAMKGIFRHSYFEAGMVHRPYLDFEEKINGYRLQGTMFLERYKIINSADFGLTFFSLLGGKMDQEYISEVSSVYPGKYGSVAFGVYNGGGYHALEYNTNKTIEGRITLRPFHQRLPGFQATYAFVRGKGNTASMPDFNNNTYLLSFESKVARAGVQFTHGYGDMRGTRVPGGDNSIANYVEGYSMFLETYFVPKTLALYMRYDNIETTERLIAGLSYYFFKRNRVLFDVDFLPKSTNQTTIYEVVIELLF